MSIKDIIKVYSDLRNQMDHKLGLEIKNWLKELLEANPEVSAIWWNQGTPFYNDGDVCEFSVSDVGEIRVTELSEDDEDEDDEKEFYETPVYLREVEDVITDHTIWPVLQYLYGDGVTVTVTRTETKVEAYIY